MSKKVLQFLFRNKEIILSAIFFADLKHRNDEILK